MFVYLVLQEWNVWNPVTSFFCLFLFVQEDTKCEGDYMAALCLGIHLVNDIKKT